MAFLRRPENGLVPEQCALYSDKIGLNYKSRQECGMVACDLCNIPDTDALNLGDWFKKFIENKQITLRVGFGLFRYFILTLCLQLAQLIGIRQNPAP